MAHVLHLLGGRQPALSSGHSRGSRMETPGKTAVFPTACDAAGEAVARLCHGTGMAGPCIFCSIVRGEIPASFVLREGGVCAFLDSRPVFKGHVLVVPT